MCLLLVLALFFLASDLALLLAGVGVDVDLMLKVSTRMSRNVVSIKPGDLLDKAAALMIERSINRLPVVNPAGEVVGIITRLDIMRCLAAVWL